MRSVCIKTKPILTPYASHLQVLNMLQVSGRCAHIWDPNSVYIETNGFSFNANTTHMYEFSFNVSTIDFNPLR